MRRGDHPRTRGVYVAFLTTTLTSGGSSPHARGLQRDIERKIVNIRIIPARAGFTGPPRRPPSCWTDHPRTRGVYTALGAWKCEGVGSSPHARGLLVA